jgi:hypothetical protein
MKTSIELMMEADMAVLGDVHLTLDDVERLIKVVRADEREQGQRWYDAVTAQHKQEILAEREACAHLAQKTVCDVHIPTGTKIYGTAVAKAIRARKTP